MSWTAIVAFIVFAYLLIGVTAAITIIATGGMKKREEVAIPLFGWPILLVLLVAVAISLLASTLYWKFIGVIWWLGGGQEPPQQNQAPQ